MARREIHMAMKIPIDPRHQHLSKRGNTYPKCQRMSAIRFKLKYLTFCQIVPPEKQPYFPLVMFHGFASGWKLWILRRQITDDRTAMRVPSQKVSVATLWTFCLTILGSTYKKMWKTIVLPCVFFPCVFFQDQDPHPPRLLECCILKWEISSAKNVCGILLYPASNWKSIFCG